MASSDSTSASFGDPGPSSGRPFPVADALPLGPREEHLASAPPNRKAPAAAPLAPGPAASRDTARQKKQWSYPVDRAANAASEPSTDTSSGVPTRQPASEPLGERAVRQASPWFASFVLHGLLLLILALWMVVDPRIRPVMLEATLVDDLGEQLDERNLAFSAELPPSDEQLLLPEPAPEVNDPFAAPPLVDVTPAGVLTIPQLADPRIGLAFRGRDQGMKQKLLAAYGGNGASEEAVALGLRWLVKRQRGDGSWSLKGDFADGAGFENRVAATAMALLALQGAGHSNHAGKYRQAVTSGYGFLLKQLDEDGSFFQDGGQHDWFYTQGMATIALCELYGMTRDESLREPAGRAIWYCCETQGPSGGWRYNPNGEGDTSVTGWILMALESARMAGLDVPYDTLNGVDRFLDTVAREDGARYAYRANEPAKRSMTAEGLLCRQFLGWNQDDPRLARGAEFLTLPENLPSYRERDVYYWYYATQMLHHLEGPAWEAWNNVSRDLLVNHQEHKGPEAGSWDPIRPTADQWGDHGGRLYVTCLSLYILEVYYRHLPLYSSRVGQSP